MGIRKALIVSAGAVLILGAGVAFLAVQFGNDFRCGGAEQQAMSEFPHFNDAQADWESNAKITGGCTASFVVDAETDDVLAYYRDHLSDRGWTLQDGPANSMPVPLLAERDRFRFHLNFFGAVSLYPPPDQAATMGPVAYETLVAARLKELRTSGETVDAECPGCAPGLQLGQTRVSISGGYRD